MTDEVRKYQVTFSVDERRRNPPYDVYTRTWTATYRAGNFCEAETQAIATLLENGDTHSTITKIEVW